MAAENDSASRPVVAVIGAVRLARPTSIWARHRYRGKRLERATRRAADFDRRWAPVQTDWANFIGGRPSLPNPSAKPAGPVPPAIKPAESGSVDTRPQP